MKNLKKLFCLLLALTMVFSFISVFADDVDESSGVIPIITVSENASEDEINAAFIEAKNAYPEIYDNNVVPRTGRFTINPYVIRSGNTANCELYFQWECVGTENYKLTHIAFDSFQLTNGGIGPWELVYANIGGSTITCTAGAVGSVRVLGVTIPTDQKVVYPKNKGLKAFIIPDGKWYSVILNVGKITIN